MRRRDAIIRLAATAAWTSAARAQAVAMPVVGYLSSGSPASATSSVAAFRQGLSEAGFVEGRNVAIEYRWAEGRNDRLSALAAELVGRKVAVIAVGGRPGIAAARGATASIPIVFMGGGDLVAAGLVASLAQPGGNLTGIDIFGRELNPKRVELLAELVPQAAKIAMLVNPTALMVEVTTRDAQHAARANGRQLSILQASTASEIDAALAAVVQLRAGALVVASDPFFNSRREQLVALAARHGVAAIYEWREFAEAGGLISYGPSFAGVVRQQGAYVGRILAGAKPDDLPIQRPTRFELIINLKTAKALGLTIPQSLLLRADEVIQ